ncbi:MAG: class I SAM-dependent methyltransferase [Acidimicrobiia bacterium]|nr:class I SAM-dependent methyltransferase [Acidimicrobiia bacterium]
MGKLASSVRRTAQRITHGTTPAYGDAPSLYWDQRHATQGESLDGVGQIGLGHAANLADYNEKWHHLAGALDRCAVDPMGRALDAGCGIGFLTERLRLRGHLVSGIDFSQEALVMARQRLGGGVPLEVQPLDQPVSGAPFDLVMCVDVLFHIVDDDVWRATVANLAHSCEPDGTLMIQEHLVEAEATASHVRWRTLAEYREVLAGWELLDQHSYRLPQADTTKDILVWRRTP